MAANCASLVAGVRERALTVAWCLLAGLPAAARSLGRARRADGDVSLGATVAAYGGACFAAATSVAAGAVALAFSHGWPSFVLLLFFQVGVCLGIAYGVRIYFSRGAAAPTPPSNRLQREPQVCVCCPVEQSALSATTSGVTGTLMGSGCGATDDTDAFAARRLSHISAGQSSVGAGASVVKGVAGTWVEVEACASGSGGGRRVEAARRRARALLRAEVAAEEDTLEALELECAIADSALDTVRPSCADFDDAVAAAWVGWAGWAMVRVRLARPGCSRGLMASCERGCRLWDGCHRLSRRSEGLILLVGIAGG